MLKKPFFSSLILGIVSSILIGVISENLPYSEASNLVIEIMTVTGAFIVALLYPQGVHTGSGTPLWGYWVMFVNLIIYVAFWYICLLLSRRVVLKDNSTKRDGTSIS